MLVPTIVCHQPSFFLSLGTQAAHQRKDEEKVTIPTLFLHFPTEPVINWVFPLNNRSIYVDLCRFQRRVPVHMEPSTQILYINPLRRDVLVSPTCMS
jgi:hypothetical protein